MVTGLVCAVPAFAHDEAAPSQDQAAQQNPFVFGSEAGMLTFYIKADKTADFEAVMAKLHQALANSDQPERKQQAKSWKLYKASEAGPNGSAVYVHILAPVLKGADYSPSKVLAEVFPNEAQALFEKYKEAFAGLGRLELTLIEDFSGPAPATPQASSAAETTPSSSDAQPQ